MMYAFDILGSLCLTYVAIRLGQNQTDRLDRALAAFVLITVVLRILWGDLL